MFTHICVDQWRQLQHQHSFTVAVAKSFHHHTWFIELMNNVKTNREIETCVIVPYVCTWRRKHERAVFPSVRRRGAGIPTTISSPTTTSRRARRRRSATARSRCVASSSTSSSSHRQTSSSAHSRRRCVCTCVRDRCLRASIKTPYLIATST